jgi:hypothetical protein
MALVYFVLPRSKYPLQYFIFKYYVIDFLLTKQEKTRRIIIVYLIFRKEDLESRRTISGMESNSNNHFRIQCFLI